MVRVNYSSRATPGSPRVHGNGSGASSSGSVRRVQDRPTRVQAPRLEHQLQADTMIPSGWPAVLPVGIVRRDPMWSRAYNGSPAGYKFVVEGGPWTWKTWLLEENLLREIEEVIANAPWPGSSVSPSSSIPRSVCTTTRALSWSRWIPAWPRSLLSVLPASGTLNARVMSIHVVGGPSQ